MLRNSVINLIGRGSLALFGGYATAAIIGAALAHSLPLARLDATLIATILSFAIFTAAAIWAFAARSLGRGALGLMLVALAGFALLKASGG